MWGLRLDEPAWSRDGRWIAFTCDDEGGRDDLWLARAGGGGVRRVTRGTADGQAPAWLPAPS